MSSRTLKPTREAVLQSAISAFAKTGYAGTSVLDILEATGLSKPTLYYYFDSKEGLFTAILSSAFDGCEKIVAEKTRDAPDLRARLIETAAGLFEFAGTHQDLMRLVFASMFAAPGEIPEQAVSLPKRRAIFDFARGLIRAGQKAGAITREFKSDELAHGYLGAVSHAIRMWLMTKEGTLNRARARRVVDLFLDGAAASTSDR